MGGDGVWVGAQPGLPAQGGEAALGHHSILESDRVGAGRGLRDEQAPSPEALRGEAHTGVGWVGS